MTDASAHILSMYQGCCCCAIVSLTVGQQHT